LLLSKTKTSENEMILRRMIVKENTKARKITLW